MSVWVKRWRRMIRGEMNRVQKEAPVVRMTSSARESTTSQGTPREGELPELHRCALFSLLFHPCRYIQICKNGVCTDGSLCPLYGIIYALRSLLLYHEAQSEKRQAEETGNSSRGNVCGFFSLCACVCLHPCSAVSYSQWLQGPWLTHTLMHAGAHSSACCCQFHPPPLTSLFGCFYLLWFQLRALSNHTCRQL